MSKGLKLLAAVAAATMTITVSAAVSQQFLPDKEVTKTQTDLEFKKINSFVAFAKTYGDYETTAHGKFVQFPAKFTTPVHTHTKAYHGVVIKGVATNPFNGDTNPAKMGPGSYWYVPAGAVHTTACISEEPCLFYTHSDGAFDLIPVK